VADPAPPGRPTQDPEPMEIVKNESESAPTLSSRLEWLVTGEGCKPVPPLPSRPEGPIIGGDGGQCRSRPYGQTDRSLRGNGP